MTGPAPSGMTAPTGGSDTTFPALARTTVGSDGTRPYRGACAAPQAARPGGVAAGRPSAAGGRVRRDGCPKRLVGITAAGRGTGGSHPAPAPREAVPTPAARAFAASLPVLSVPGAHPQGVGAVRADPFRRASPSRRGGGRGADRAARAGAVDVAVPGGPERGGGELGPPEARWPDLFVEVVPTSRSSDVHQVQLRSGLLCRSRARSVDAVVSAGARGRSVAGCRPVLAGSYR